MNPLLYHRLRWLWPVLSHRWMRAAGWLLFVFWLVFAALVLLLRHVVLPNVTLYQPLIEAAASQAIGQPVRIGRLEARWQGLNPDLVLNDLDIIDARGERALTLGQVDAVLSWQSLWRGRVMLSLLAVQAPVLHMRRDPSGKISVAGIEASGEGDGAALQWLLMQSHIRVQDATIVWQDELRHAPELVLEGLDFGLDNRGRRHRFGLTALPPVALASRLDVRGEIKGDLDEPLESLAARLFVELDYADLAAWRNWVDYPVNLPQGRGALRLWGDLDEGEGKLTADVALEEVCIRLASGLPELALATMRGRLLGSYSADKWFLGGRKIELLTNDGVRVAPTDFAVSWQRVARPERVTGTASATFLDLGVLRGLAAYMPLDADSRRLLLAHQPNGQVSELRASWELSGDQLTRYSLRAGFNDLALLPGGYVPGASGLSGMVDASERSGLFLVDAGRSNLSLPAVFPEPDIVLDELKVRTSWQRDNNGQLDIRLEKFDFAGPDAAARARGTYRYRGDGPGEIDLTADIQRGEGTAVWRYMPHSVNADARAWLRRGIVGGRGHDGKLVLKGDLAKFPFREPGSGTFYVTAKASDAKVDYADAWPPIEHIDADLRFGIGMQLKAHRGQILGAKLGEVRVEIPDFEAAEEMLLVHGLASGPTSEFLSFIEKSPVSAKIDHFTQGMKAGGDGRLDLELDLPLRHIDHSKVRGVYNFQNNQLQPIAGLPPVQQVNGQLRLTESSVLADNINGRIFGGPVKVQVKNEGERVAVQASGQANIAAVRSHFGWAALGPVSGSAPWRADIAVRRRQAEVSIDSNLVGLTSTLPEPFNKAAATALPLHIERSVPDPGREQFRMTLGKLAKGLFVQREENGVSRWEKGALVLGDGELRLPEKGLSVQVALPRVDGDAWKAVFSAPAPAAAPSPAESNGFSLGQVRVRTPALRFLGREHHNVDVSLRPRDADWLIALNMREAVGDLVWRGAGDGLIEGRLRRLALGASGGADASPAAEASPARSLPAINVTVDEFLLSDRLLGQLDVRARNEAGIWQLEQLNIRNPESQLKGKGSWQGGAHQQTRLEFELNSSDLGKLLDRFGYADAIKRGTVKASGNLSWDGGLTAIHYPTLSGSMNLRAEKGQFNKLEPGIGKLLGLISLQSLPRRLTLDFRDIFSDGLAFDSIDAKLAVRRGIMRTSEPLRISGPAAQIEMQGETDLKAETQDLRVQVRPEISTAAAVGAALVNPVVGAATLVANTVLRNPLNRFFSYRYHVTGNWAEPQVVKTAESGEPAAPAAVPTEESKP